jgi:hypothetical protein
VYNLSYTVTASKLKMNYIWGYANIKGWIPLPKRIKVADQCHVYTALTLGQGSIVIVRQARGRFFFFLKVTVLSYLGRPLWREGQEAVWTTKPMNCRWRTHIDLKMFRIKSKTEHAVAQWLRHYATSRKVTGSRPDEVNDFFLNLPKFSWRTRS